MAPAMPYGTEKARFNKEKRVIFMSKGEKTRLPLFAFAEIVLMRTRLQKWRTQQKKFCLTGKSALLIFDRHANLKYKYGNRHFWAEGYYVSTVGLNEATIKKYIEDQDKHDIALGKLSVKEYEDPFKGGK